MIGRRSETIPCSGRVADVEVDQGIAFLNIDLKRGFIPSRVTGRILGMEKDDRAFLAISVNGVIEAVSRTFPAYNRKAEWSAVLPESVFMPGRNEVEIFTVTDEGGKVVLGPTRDSRVEYRLCESEGSVLITSSEGDSWSVAPSSLKAFLDIAQVREGSLIFAGWSGDTKISEIAKEILVFVDGHYAFSGRCNAERPDLEKAFKNPILKNAGFRFSMPVSLLNDLDSAEIRFFAISGKGQASEFRYPQGYRWAKSH